jgi:non-canonical poly(A) RNA polymerase PAPD5/7
VVSTRQFSEARGVKQPLFQLRQFLKDSGITDDVQVNHRAKVPILTFTTSPAYGEPRSFTSFRDHVHLIPTLFPPSLRVGSFNVDIGINNTDGLHGITVINDHLARMPALRPLVLVIKAFLTQRGLGSAANSGLGSYAIICMCIAFLMVSFLPLLAIVTLRSG